MNYICSICDQKFLKNHHLKSHYREIHPAIHVINPQKISDMFSDIHVYWINLERSINRNEKMTDMFEKYGIKNTRINGYDGKILNSYKDIECISDITDYELGCTLSHLKAIKTAYENNENHAVIMEDDIIIDRCDKWKYKISEIIDLAPDDWEIIKLHCNNGDYLSNLLLKSNDVLFSPWNINSWSAGCYIINKIGMKNIINKYFKGGKCVINCPTAVSDIIIYSNLITYDYVFPTFIHQVNESLIHIKHLNAQAKALHAIFAFFNSQ